MAAVTVTLNLESSEKLDRLLADGQAGTGPLAAAWKQIAKRYEVETLRNFDTASRGGLDWPPLALSTVRRRKAPNKRRRAETRSSLARSAAGVLVSAGRTVTILKDSGTTRNSLQIGTPGNDTHPIKNGISFGFAETPRPPRAGAKKQDVLTVAEVAGWHHRGDGHNPRRRILRYPSDRLLRQMTRDLERALETE